jgi:hypothetical protein
MLKNVFMKKNRIFIYIVFATIVLVGVAEAVHWKKISITIAAW